MKLCLLPAAWPFLAVFFCGRSLKDALFTGTAVSNADMLSVAYFAVIAMFLFEVIYRLNISPVSLIHHTAGCALAARQVSAQVMHEDASTDSQFRLLILYGVFEVAFETVPHVAVIYYRCQPKTAEGMRRTSRVWLVSGCSSLVGTTAEVAAMGVFMWKNWVYWDIEMRVPLPILHFAFMAAQVHGARVGFQLWREFGGRARARDARIKERGRSEDTHSGRSTEGGSATGAEKGVPNAVAIRVEREPGADGEDMEGSDGATSCRYCAPVDKLSVPIHPAC